MRCPWCNADDDRVVDSRPSEGGSATRRRRACNQCGRRFTTFERVEEVGMTVLKRDGTSEPFSRAKLAAGIHQALTNRPVDPVAVEAMVDRLEAKLRRKGPALRSQQIGTEVLAALRRTDEVAYLRFASVYKDFQQISDFRRELGALSQKKEPARRTR
jgi:transcriptional repressor NrdR